MAEYSTYKNRYVSGSVAYDFSSAEYFPEYAAGRQVEIPAPRRMREEVVSEETAVVSQTISPAAILGFALVAVLMVFSLFARAQLSQVSLQVVEQQTALEALDAEHQKLLVQYEFAFNLAEVEEYAVRELGMQQPRSDQVYYINSGVTDKAEIVTPEQNKNGLEKVFSVIGEYFQ